MNGAIAFVKAMVGRFEALAPRLKEHIVSRRRILTSFIGLPANRIKVKARRSASTERACQQFETFFSLVGIDGALD
jgi:hypothetical protein